MEGDFSWERTYENIADRFERSDLRRVTRDYLFELRQTLANILDVAEHSRILDPQADMSNVVRETGHLLTTYLGLEMVCRTSAIMGHIWEVENPRV